MNKPITYASEPEDRIEVVKKESVEMVFTGSIKIKYKVDMVKKEASAFYGEKSLFLFKNVPEVIVPIAGVSGGGNFTVRIE